MPTFFKQSRFRVFSWCSAVAADKIRFSKLLMSGTEIVFVELLANMITQIGALKVKQWRDRKWLVVESERLAECIRFIKSSEFASFEGLIISRDLGYKTQTLSFLEEVPFVTSISISDPIADATAIYALRGLRVLNLAENKNPIDLSRFPELIELAFDWSPKIRGLDRCHCLRKLTIGRFNPKARSFMELPSFPLLNELSIVRSTIHGLEGIGRYTSLKALELYYMTNLATLEGLTCPVLETLTCSRCKKLQHHDAVASIKALRVLKFNYCGAMPSIKFIREMPHLRTFTFVDTVVSDGDVSPCFGLDEVGFSNMRRYSHTLKDVRAAIARRAKQ